MFYTCKAEVTLWLDLGKMCSSVVHQLKIS